MPKRSSALITSALVLLAALGGCAGPAGTDDPGEHAHSAHAATVPLLHAAYRPERAMETLAFGDRFYRAPASDGYEAVLEHLRARLEAAGFGAREWLQLEERVVEADFPAWTPRSARLTLEGAGGTQVLHAFEDQAGVDRLLLPIGAPACDVSGSVVFDLGHVFAGTILVTDAPASFNVLRRAESRGAVAVVSSYLAGYNVQPETEELLAEAIKLRVYPAQAELPSCQISPASHEAIRAEHEARGGVHLSLRAEVEHTRRPLRLLQATIVGASRPDEAVVLPSHLEYAGASDNGSGFAATLEGTISLVESIERGDLARPARSLVFLWGPEIRASEAWLAQTQRRAVASITLITAGDAGAHGGSPLLLERGPDPGAVRTLPPDEHTLWGSDPVEADTLRPDGLAIVVRCAMADVAAHVGGWRLEEHPWEGGSDHDAFLEQGVPAVLLWHFTPPWYHTSLDRLDKVDPEELRRSAVAAFAAALAVAAPRGEDLPRYLSALAQDERTRVQAALVVQDEELAQLWRDWCAGAEGWLRTLAGD